MNLTASSIVSTALQLASERGLLPLPLSTQEIREQIADELRRRSFFSARTANAWYLAKANELVQKFIAGEGFGSDIATLKMQLRELLNAAGYTPEGGFPGDAKLGIPPATAGSLRDLGSEARLTLILNTQADLARGRAQQLAGAADADLFPAWELVRVFSAEAPRDWLKRWDLAGGPKLTNEDGARVLIAPKNGEVWSVLGSSDLFDDALDVDHPPFAFNSGMRWRAVPLEEYEALTGTTPANKSTLTTEQALQEFIYRGFMPKSEWTAKPKIGGKRKAPDSVTKLFKGGEKDLEDLFKKYG